MFLWHLVLTSAPPLPAMQRLRRLGTSENNAKLREQQRRQLLQEQLDRQHQQVKEAAALAQLSRSGGGAPQRRGSFFITGLPGDPAGSPMGSPFPSTAALQKAPGALFSHKYHSVSDLMTATGVSGGEQLLSSGASFAVTGAPPAPAPPPRETKEEAFRRLLLLPAPVGFAAQTPSASARAPPPSLGKLGRTGSMSGGMMGPLATPHAAGGGGGGRQLERRGSASSLLGGGAEDRPRSRRGVNVSVPAAGGAASWPPRLISCELPVIREVADIVTSTGKVLAPGEADDLAGQRATAPADAQQEQGQKPDGAAAYALPSQSSDVASASMVYVAHPSMLHPMSATDAELSAVHGVPQAPSSAALAVLVAEAQARDATVRSGYVRPAELAAWVLDDLLPVVNATFPAAAMPKPADLWTVSSAAFGASRSAVFAHCSATVSVVQRLDQYALCAYPRLKPLVLLGAKVRAAAAVCLHCAGSPLRTLPLVPRRAAASRRYSRSGRAYSCAALWRRPCAASSAAWTDR